MGYIDPILVGSSGALIIGTLLIIAGLYLRPRHRPQTRQGAVILANFAAILGLATVLAGTLFLVRAV